MPPEVKTFARRYGPLLGAAALVGSAWGFGAVAIQRLAVRRAAVGRLRIKELHVDRLIVDQIERPG